MKEQAGVASRDAVPSDEERRFARPAVTGCGRSGITPGGVVRERPVGQGGAGMGQPPLMRGIDGGARDDTRRRAARGFRLIAHTMRAVAADLEGTDFHGRLAREATVISMYADELDGGLVAGGLRSV